MRDPALSQVLRQARAQGLRPFEIFAEAKRWVDRERLRLRGLVESIEESVRAHASAREGEAARTIQKKRGPKPKVEDEAQGVERDLRYAKGAHSHLLELRRAAIQKIKAGERERGDRVPA